MDRQPGTDKSIRCIMRQAPEAQLKYLIVSWLPYFTWITAEEPWKAIGHGFYTSGEILFTGTSWEGLTASRGEGNKAWPGHDNIFLTLDINFPTRGRNKAGCFRQFCLVSRYYIPSIFYKLFWELQARRQEREWVIQGYMGTIHHVPDIYLCTGDTLVHKINTVTHLWS